MLLLHQEEQRAKILLFSTNLTISEIGNQCAFTNISHFIKLFKQRYGDTPAALRRHTPTDK
jgi:AraC-like DNA-binding protein